MLYTILIGIIITILIGIAGSFVGGYISGIVGIGGGGLLWTLIFGVIGALVLLFVYRLVMKTVAK